MASSPQYRTIWLSDLHLGTPQAKASFVLDFLQHHEAERYYLVGDVIDGWALQRSWHWPRAHNKVIQGLLRTAQSTDVIYVPGNHDAAAREYDGLQLGGIAIQKHAVHTLADGRRFWVTHGDEFEGVVRHARWVELLGQWTYAGVLTMDHWLERARRFFNLPYWSLANALKESNEQAQQFIATFEDAAAQRAQEKAVDGIICGHIHRPQMRLIDGHRYLNTGDWVQNCTALVEHRDGTLELRRWIPKEAEGTIATEASPRDGASGHRRPPLHRPAEG
jgi:UDP-2,3-diacylglucosamine pyrophosphatase LpxH